MMKKFWVGLLLCLLLVHLAIAASIITEKRK